MSTSTPHNRQPAGTPVGGQFAAATHPGPDATVALTPDTAAAPTSQELIGRYVTVGQQITAASAHEVATAILADHPTATALELEHSDQGMHYDGIRVTDAGGNELADFAEHYDTDDADLSTVLSNISSEGRHDFIGTTGDRRTRVEWLDLQAAAAQQPGDVRALIAEYRQLDEQITAASAREIAAAVLTAHPSAAYIELEHSDQGYWYDGGEIFSSDGDFVADFHDFEDYEADDVSTALSNISSNSRHDFVVFDLNGRNPRLDLAKAAEAGR